MQAALVSLCLDVKGSWHNSAEETVAGCFCDFLGLVIVKCLSCAEVI